MSFLFATTQAASTKGCSSLQTIAKCKEGPSNWNAPLTTTIVSKNRSCWITRYKKAGKQNYGSLLASKGHALACTRNCSSSPDLGAWLNPRPQTNGFVWACRTSCLHAKMGLARSVRFATTQAAASTEGCPSLISSPHIAQMQGMPIKIEGGMASFPIFPVNRQLAVATELEPELRKFTQTLCVPKSMSRRWLVESLKNLSPPSR